MTFADDDRTIPSRGVGDQTLPVRPGGGGPPGGGPGGVGGDDEERRKLPWIIAGVLALGLLIGAVIALVTSGGDDEGDRPRRTTTTSTSTSTTTSSPTTTAPAPSSPQITQFAFNPASPSCPSNLQLTWSTQNANSVTISIDGPGAFQTGLPPNGSLQVPFVENSMDPPQCSHTYLLTAIGANNQQVTQEITVSAAS